MINVELVVPCVDRQYDFNLNEDIPVSTVTEEIVSLICQKEKCELINGSDSFLLFDSAGSKILSLGLTLYENGVKTGDRLLLV